MTEHEKILKTVEKHKSFFEHSESDVAISTKGIYIFFNYSKKYDDYWEMRPNGTKTGSSGNKTNGNPNIAMNDGKHNYFINTVQKLGAKRSFKRIIHFFFRTNPLSLRAASSGSGDVH